MKRQEPYIFEDIPAVFITKAANYCRRRYGAYGLEFDDFKQEMLLWLYEPKNTDKVLDWLSAEPQRTTRIYRSLLDVAISIGETEKAQRLGYSTDDVHWYSPASIEGLLPLALDDDYHDEGKTSDLFAMVVDVRRALETTGLTAYFVQYDSVNDEDRYRENVRLLIDFLGGSRPTIGRRRVMSNATALSITKDAA